MIKVAIVEDNIISRKALQEKLSYFADIAVVQIVENGKVAVEMISKCMDIDLIFMDIEMPVLNGIEATAIIKNQFPHIKIVMITIYDDDEHIFKAILAGADSYILKETKAEKIYETIIDTLNGGAVMSPTIAVKTLKLLKQTVNPVQIEVSAVATTLSARETEILNQLSKGLTNKVISELLFISPFTVKRHIENIYQKLQAHNRTDLLEKARKDRLL